MVVLALTLAALIASFTAKSIAGSWDLESGIAVGLAVVCLAVGIGEILHDHGVCGVY